VNRHAKASSAGSIEGSRSSKRRGPVLAVFALAICALALFAAPAISAPLTSATMGPITNVSYGSAHVSGTIHTNGPTYWRFDYSTDGVNWVEGPGEAHGGPIDPGDTAIEADLTGLKGGTKYFVRIGTYNQATNEAPLSPEPNPEFTTLAADPPSVETIDNASEVEYTTAEVSGKVNRPANSNDLTCNFEYVSDAQFTATGFEGAGQASCGPVATVGSSTVSTQLTGLSSGTTYHLRLAVANASAADSKVAAATFTTQTPTAPALVLNPATEVKYTTAQISGSVDPEGGNIQAGEPLPIHWELQYTPDPVEYGWSLAGEGTIEGAAAEESNPIPVPPANLESLQNGREYKFRLVVSSAGSVTISPEGSFETEAVSAPIVAADDATAVTGTTAHVSGHVTAGNLDPAFDANCSFDYVSDQHFQVDGFASAQQIACGPTNPVTGTSSTEVKADPTGLEANTVYHLRLRAENQGGKSTDVASSFETDPIAPTAQTLFANQVTADSALLTARVNPHNSAVTYQFEWGTDATYGSFVPATPTPLGFLGNSAHVITAPIASLQENSTYHFRISATNTETSQTTHGADHVLTTLSGSGPAPCANEVRRAESNSLALPDCRGYELVTPQLKDFPFGAPVSGNFAIAAAAGNAIAYNTSGPLPGSAAGTFENFNISRRTASGWISTPTSPPQNPVGGGQNFPKTIGFSSNLSQVFMQENPTLAAGAPADVISLYVRNAETASYEFITPGNGSFTLFWNLVGATADSTHLVFETLGDPVLPGMPGGFFPSLYEWSGGQLHYVGFVNGTPVEGVTLGQGFPFRVANAISADGSRIIFGWGNQLYDRIDNTSTKHISASQRTIADPNGTAPAGFWGASTDGGKVFFTSSEKLTDDATTGVNSTGRDLYAYDLGSETLTDLSVDTNPADPQGADVQGVVGNSDDGQYVYFVADGDLGGGATSGAPNLYVSHGNQVKFIATMDPADYGAWGSYQKAQDGQPGLTARVAASGDLVIQSIASLTGYDNVDPSTATPTSQVFRYATASGVLSCLSCRANGTSPSGNSTITPPFYESSIQRNITADGSRVFFSSTDAIVPGDINGKSDAYEWADGSTKLISDGTSGVNSFFQDASPSGDDVFIATAAPLVGQDTDSHVDLYDARAGGGFAKPPAAPVSCEGEACRGAGSAAPGAEAPVTPNFIGPGDPIPSKDSSKKRAKALKACKAKHSKKQRKKCESQVKKRFANKSGRGK
jgi:hypothetical protein